MKNFKTLPVWQKGMKIATMTYELSQSFHDKDQYHLVTQLNEVAVTIPSNIAVGSSYERDNDYRNFLRGALGACFQLETLLLIIEELKLSVKNSLRPLIEAIDEEKKLLIDFMRKLIARSS